MVEQITTALGVEIIAEAQRWLELECVEKDGQKVYCANAKNPDKYIVWQALGKDRSATSAYCAAFAWEVISGACNKAGVENKISSEAGAAALIKKGKSAGMRVDTVPTPGCIYYHYVGGNNHVGIVVEMQESQVITVEANTESGGVEGIRQRERSISENNIKANQIQFLHIEEMHGTETMAQILPVGSSSGDNSSSVAINTGYGRLVVTANENGISVKRRTAFF